MAVYWLFQLALVSLVSVNAAAFVLRSIAHERRVVGRRSASTFSRRWMTSTSLEKIAFLDELRGKSVEELKSKLHGKRIPCDGPFQKEHLVHLVYDAILSSKKEETDAATDGNVAGNRTDKANGSLIKRVKYYVDTEVTNRANMISNKREEDHLANEKRDKANLLSRKEYHATNERAERDNLASRKGEVDVALPNGELTIERTENERKQKKVNKDVVETPLWLMTFNGSYDENDPSVPEWVKLQPSDQPFATIELELLGGVIGGGDRQKLNLMVDTACSGVVLKPSVVRKYGFPLKMSLPTQAVGGTAETTQFSEIPKFVVGGHAFDPMPAVVQDVYSLPDTIDGIVGLSFLGKFDTVEFDFSKQQLRLYKNDQAVPPANLEVVAKGEISILSSMGIYVVDVFLGGRGPVSMIVDTGGSTSTFLSWKGVRDLGLSPDSPAVSRIPQRTDDTGNSTAKSEVFGFTHRIHVGSQLQLGRRTAPGMSLAGKARLGIDIGPIPLLEMLASEGVGGVLGMDIFTRCSIIRMKLKDGQQSLTLIQDETAKQNLAKRATYRSNMNTGHDDIRRKDTANKAMGKSDTSNNIGMGYDPNSGIGSRASINNSMSRREKENNNMNMAYNPYDKISRGDTAWNETSRRDMEDNIGSVYNPYIEKGMQDTANFGMDGRNTESYMGRINNDIPRADRANYGTGGPEQEKDKIATTYNANNGFSRKDTGNSNTGSTKQINNNIVDTPLRLMSLRGTVDVDDPAIPNGLKFRPSDQPFATIELDLMGKSKFDNQRKLNLMVDTACSGLVLKPSAVQKYGLPMKQTSVTSTGASGTAMTTGLTELSRFLVGGKSFGPIPAAVQDIGSLPETIDGIIGLSFLGQFETVEFDYAQQRLRLYKDETPSSEREVMAKGELIMLGSMGIYAVDVYFGGRGPVRMIVDTGGSNTFLSWKGVGDLGLSRGSPAISPISQPMGAMGNTAQVFELTHRIHVSSQLTLDRQTSQGLSLSGTARLPVDIGDIPLLQALASQNVGGILGLDVFTRCTAIRVTLKCRKRFLTLLR